MEPEPPAADGRQRGQPNRRRAPTVVGWVLQISRSHFRRGATSSRRLAVIYNEARAADAGDHHAIGFSDPDFKLGRQPDVLAQTRLLSRIIRRADFNAVADFDPRQGKCGWFRRYEAQRRRLKKASFCSRAILGHSENDPGRRGYRSQQARAIPIENEDAFRREHALSAGLPRAGVAFKRFGGRVNGRASWLARRSSK